MEYLGKEGLGCLWEEGGGVEVSVYSNIYGAHKYVKYAKWSSQCHPYAEWNCEASPMQDGTAMLADFGLARMVPFPLHGPPCSSISGTPLLIHIWYSVPPHYSYSVLTHQKHSVLTNHRYSVLTVHRDSVLAHFWCTKLRHTTILG